MAKSKTDPMWEMENRVSTKPKKKVRRVTMWVIGDGHTADEMMDEVSDGVFRTKAEAQKYLDYFLAPTVMKPKKITIEWEE